MPNENKANKLPQYIAAITVCIGALALGTILGWSANITENLKAGDLNGFKMDTDMLGWTGSTVTLGATLVCFPIGFVADAFGRKPTVLASTIPFIIGWLLIIFAQHISMVYAGRLLTGIAGGSFAVTAPLYTSEIAETEVRGRLGTFFQLFITIGVLYAQVFGYCLPMMLHHLACLVVAVTFGIVFIFQPESPVYLMKKGKTEKALKTFNRLRGKDYDPSAEIKLIEAHMAEDAESPGCWEAMKSKAAKKATLICFMLMFLQQMSGINAVTFYTNDIFTSAGSTLPPHWCVILGGSIQVIATAFSSFAIDKLGRKILLMTSCGFVSLSCFLLGFFFSLKDHKIIDEYGVQDIGFLPILSIIMFMMAFAIGLGPIPWLASAEIFPPEIKAKCTSAAATFNWFLAFLITRFYLNVAHTIGTDITFYFFSAVCLSGVFFVLFVVPETKGKTFAEIQAELSGK
ncbi:hypothetical protein NQ315_005156 [Exocentrus adspersus]|uniref:Major facilitator superfamily (MFS) profile domain-containing protein n=1 Tax=Exocentrus adspersus TaxID=1586481 RepID=A0AAV8VUQ1_9CUCU|nr:hypothetical protein NQ315_005156 [Exocentrus adspersus]